MTPAKQAAFAVAVFAVMDRAGVLDSSNDALAAALKELARVTRLNSTSPFTIEAAELFAIADSIENAMTTLTPGDPTDAR